ncbi:archaeosortase A (PGF-CTERM-specific) [Methanolinea mesophila]|uniref:archaeosortase A n=1 Tax=Methanolinea mesophila TaxID=547055 RepID=UPI001AE2B038|nr:archaeosortase A [Methanolinea mesophila]MBP1928194.1 archaeosortase A (PGF-CTERM-specific) [Methanolinea mesophila]
MEEYLVLFSGIFFIAFLLPVRARKYFGMLGWTGMVLFLFAEIPYYFSINNFLYPLIAVLSVPFLAFTVKYLNRENLRVMQLTTAASVAFLIYAPFAFTPLGDWLISVVVGQVVWLLDAFGYPTSLYAWNTVIRNGFRVEIILACTGIQAIAIMLGVAAAVKTTLRQKVAAFLMVVPTIYILNLIRNTAVIIAYTEQWFPYFPEIAGNGEYGYESFFWAHNVFAELLALVLLVAIAYGLFRLIPELARFATELFALYLNEVRDFTGRKKTPPSPPSEKD